MNRCRFRYVNASVRTSVAALAAALLVAGPGLPLEARAQEAGARSLEDAMPPEYAVRVRETAREASQAGVPPGLVVRKAFEGAAKGYPPDRVVQAVEAYALRLREAVRLMGPDQRPAGLAAAAEALRTGVPPDAIRTLVARDRGNRDLAVPLIVLGDLTEAGVPTADALRVVESAMDDGARGDQMLGLSAAVRRQMRQGADWQTAVDRVRRRAAARRLERDRQLQPDGARSGQSPSRRPESTTPVPPGSDPPQRMRDGS